MLGVEEVLLQVHEVHLIFFDRYFLRLIDCYAGQLVLSAIDVCSSVLRTFQILYEPVYL